VPFCRHKCPYCSFISYDGRADDITLYADALKRELGVRAGGERVRSVYFGGGTPSLLPAEHVIGILRHINTLFTIDRAAEITMEANPGTIDRACLKAVREAGINRLSLGVQSFNDDELKMLGRIHTAAEAVEAIEAARSAGFDNLNIDLIYGLPGQTAAGWRKSLEKAVSLKPEHISLYALTLEEDTPLYKTIEAGGLPAIDSDTAADHYELAEEMLAARGYGHYEISNWALPGRESRHNLTYWRNEPYIGVGAAAHSCMNGRRFANTKDLDKYIAGFSGETLPPPELDEKITPELELAESVILGLRLGEGIKIEDIRQRYGVDVLTRYRPQVEEMVGAGLLERSNGNIRLTGRGRLMSNEVFWRFLPD
jgi:oxygen-independent coproporphyrinogen-3 oxidase